MSSSMFTSWSAAPLEFALASAAIRSSAMPRRRLAILAALLGLFFVFLAAVSGAMAPTFTAPKLAGIGTAEEDIAISGLAAATTGTDVKIGIAGFGSGAG